MKRIEIIFLGIFTICAYLLFPGCSDMNDIQQQYLDREKKLYLGITDSLTSYPGEGRVKLKWFMNADPNIEATVIYWNMRQDSVVKPFTRKEKGIQADSIIIGNLPEGTYTFELINKNARGDRSISSSVQGASYGDVHRSTLKNRNITAMKVVSFDKEKQTSDIEINWGSKIQGVVGTKIVYIKRSTGERKMIFVPIDETTTLLTDVGNRINNTDDLLEVSTLHFTRQNVDTLSTFPLKEQLCIYSASGTRSDYGSDGTLLGTTSYDNLVKILYRVSSFPNADVYECNWVGESPKLSPSLFRMTLTATNGIKTDGYFTGVLNTISDVEEGVFTPSQQKLKLKYRYLKSGGTYSIVEEEYIPANLTLPAIPEKVYSLGDNKEGRFFTKGNDLLQLDKSGKLWLYKPHADKTFGASTEIASGWPFYNSIFYMPDNRIMMYDVNNVYSIPILNDSYDLGARTSPGAGWSSTIAIRLMPFKNHAIIMTNDAGILKKISINQSNGWVGGFVDLGSGFKDYWKIVPYDNSLLCIDGSGDLWYMTLSDSYALGARLKIGSGWNKYIDVIKQGSALLCIDPNGDLWRYDFSPELPWNID
ncbi:DUF4998 domain-containing protein [Proteiniphilum sp.]|nr:DUF4998 domain-containing protein [Proteiniphilum sp.]MEA4917174.1 DUF4998 domain-containing protein [Proteiniphilum sp.]